MDGRNSDAESIRAEPPNGVGVDGPADTPEGLPLPAHVADEILSSVGFEGARPQHNQRIDLRLPNSLLRRETTGSSTTTALSPDEMAQASLPADDGMGWLRKRIHAIRALDLGNHEKARMIHDLMTERYHSSQISQPILSAHLPSPWDPESLEHSDGLSFANESMLNTSRSEPPPTPSTLPYANTFALSPEDVQPTYAPKKEPESPVVEAGDEDPDTEDIDEATLGCQHYQRNVKLQCYTCKKWYTCRFCHDEAEDHHLIRRDTKNMLCMLCGHAQPAAQLCRTCGEQTAQYYCSICKLWDNDGKKSIYHCNDCGICRIGLGLGKDFFHCKTCGVCLPISIEDTHRCIERSTQCDCPICGDYMFTSPETVVVMRCGHSIHSKCLSEYSKLSSRCPICSKTISNMESTFRNLDRTIESQPMPAEFKDTKSLIYCNDCGAKSVVKYHWLGLKCDLCESYNTAQIRLLQGDMPAFVDEGVSEGPIRPRSSSFAATEESTTSMAALYLDTRPIPQSRLSVPASAGTERQFVSYNMTRGRAISPIVSNYFGLPPERESEKPSSLPFFGGTSRNDKEGDYGALSFLSKKLRDRYGFLAGETTLADGALDAEEEESEDDDDDDDDEAASLTSAADDEDGEREDDDDDPAEYIDIFGHR